jgi:hypothetical protein
MSNERSREVPGRAPWLSIIYTVFALWIAGARGYGSPYSHFNVPAAGPLGTYVAAVSGSNIVGYYFDPQGARHSFEYGSGRFISIDDTNGVPMSTVALGIDGSNVVGNFTDADGVQHGFIFNGAGYTTLDATTTGTSPVTATSIAGISGSNIVGTYTAGTEHGFLYNGSTFETLDGPMGVSPTDYTELGTYPTGVNGSTVVGWTYSVAPGNEYFYQGYVYTSGTFTPTQCPGEHSTTTHLTGIGADGIIGWDGGTDEYDPPAAMFVSGTNEFSLGEVLNWANPEIYFEPHGISGNVVVGHTGVMEPNIPMNACIVTAPGATNPIADPYDEFDTVTFGGTITEQGVNNSQVKLPLNEKELLVLLGAKVKASEVRFYYDRTNARIIIGSVAHTDHTAPGADVPVKVYGSLFSFYLNPLGDFDLGGGSCTAINDGFFGSYSGNPETVRNVFHNHVSFRVSNGSTTIVGSFRETRAP